MEVSIIIPTKDRGEVFNETLHSALEALGNLDGEIIVVNDSKSSIPVIPDVVNVKLVHNPKSGVASARNLGASLAQAELLIFIDDDFLVSSFSIQKAIEYAWQHPKEIHLFNWVYPPALECRLSKTQFGRYLSTYGFTTLEGWLGNDWREDEVFELKDGASYFLPIMKSVFNAVGGYNDSFPHAGAEDYEFVQRAKKKGIKFYLNKSLTLYHNERDRLDIKSWLLRKKRNGETIKKAVSLSHTELTFHYSLSKKIALEFFLKIRPLIFLFLKAIPNSPMFDAIYFRLTHLLFSVYFFEGYEK
jgi:GT2 family glycosyltransferase